MKMLDGKQLHYPLFCFIFLASTGNGAGTAKPRARRIGNVCFVVSN
jgi:hypothetical protein